MYDYARHLIEGGFRVMVLTGDNNRPKPDDNWAGFPPGMEVHYCRKLGGWRSRYYFDYSWKELTGFFDRHWREIDFIHLYQTRCLFNVVALWAAQKYGLKIVLSSFGSMPRRHSLLRYFYDLLFVFPVARRASLLLAQTRNESAVYERYGGRKEHIELLPLAVDLIKRPAIEARMRQEFREQYGIPQAAWLFLFVGRLHPMKGVEFLVECFASVAASLPAAHLAIVGHDEGSLANILRIIKARKLESRVTLCGALFDIHRWRAYAAADCFTILPQNFEETSLASLEALSCGTPVITNNRADVPWMEEYGAGEVVSAGRKAEVVNAMMRTGKAPAALVAERRRAAMCLIREKFEIGAVTSQLIGLFSRAALIPERNEMSGLMLVGALPSAVVTSGQAVCFKLLVDGLAARRLAGPVVNLSSVGGHTGTATIRRFLEYFSILIKVGWFCLTRTNGVYITIAQSRHGFLRDAAIIGIARLCGHQVVLHLHGGNYDHFYSTQTRLVKALIRLSLRQVRSIIVLADSLRGCFAFDPILHSKLHVVSNSLLANVPSILPERVTGRPKKLILLYLSNLIESKGYMEVLEVLSVLRERKGIDAAAVFCGTFLVNRTDDVRVQNIVQARQLFENRARELGVTNHISYRGSVNGAEKDRVLRDSHFLLFPTRYDAEGQPVVLIEALAYGLPAITTNYRANPEMIIDQVTGYLVDWRDTAGMAHRIEQLWQQPLAYAEMSARCRAHFEARFTPKVHIDAMTRILFPAKE